MHLSCPRPRWKWIGSGVPAIRANSFTGGYRAPPARPRVAAHPGARDRVAVGVRVGVGVAVAAEISGYREELTLC